MPDGVRYRLDQYEVATQLVEHDVVVYREKLDQRRGPHRGQQTPQHEDYDHRTVEVEGETVHSGQLMGRWGGGGGGEKWGVKLKMDIYYIIFEEI